MIEFAWPWVLLSLPLPLLVRWLLPAADAGEGAALRVPVLDDFRLGESARVARPERRLWHLALALLAWALLVLAAARPQWLGEPIELPVSGRDLMLAVDLSGSMRETDFELAGRQVDRLTATKQVAGRFIQRRVGDRIGLILFGEQAYLQAPLTFDRETVRSLLDESAIGLAGAEATAIGDAIGLAVKRLQNVKESSRVLILLTDGVNNAGAVDPLKAAELAAQAGLKIYTIGIGADQALVRDLFGTRRVNPSRDLDEKTLKAIAERTGGRYFRARDTGELAQIYVLLDQLEPIEQEKQVFRPTRALFIWPLATALALGAVLLALPLLSPLPRTRAAHAR
jgi:Ca-activated chloride channel family protein